MKKLICLLLLCTGCKHSTMFLRYQYDVALQNLPPCSKVHKVNNEYITYSLVEESTNNVYFSHTNYYKAYYSSEGKIYKTVPVK